jgi:hypothetical protein
VQSPVVATLYLWDATFPEAAWLAIPGLEMSTEAEVLSPMSVLSRFRRISVWSLEVGDVIRFRALHQSKSGFIVRLKGHGRIAALDRHKKPAGAEPPYVEGMLQDHSGILSRFKLDEHQQVFRLRRAKDGAPTGGEVEPVSEKAPEEAGHPEALN